MRKRFRRSRWLLLAFAIVLGVCLVPQKTQAGEVAKRLAQVRKEIPHGSRFNEWVYATTMQQNGSDIRPIVFRNGGCNALVAYATMRIFHNPYVPGAVNYNRIGTASTTSESGMRGVFRKAKTGDVIRWHSGDNEYHFAMFLSANSRGIYVYENNFGSRNQVWYRHFWQWKNMRSWTKGASQVSVYRSKNYAKVDKKKAAKKLKAGEELTIDGVTYQVMNNSLRGGKLKVVSTQNPVKEYPKAIGLNYDMAAYLKKCGQSYVADDVRVHSYDSVPSIIYDEQFFTVVSEGNVVLEE